MAVGFSFQRVGVEAVSRDELFRSVVEDLYARGEIPEVDDPIHQLLEREAVQSTAIGGGIALPHARSAACKNHVAVALRLARPIDFDAPDGSPVDLVFLILGPDDSPGDHVRLLGRIAQAVSRPGAVDDLRSAPDDASFGRVLDTGLGS
jgi:PTS system nitrogen regulatory IIA component